MSGEDSIRMMNATLLGCSGTVPNKHSPLTSLFLKTDMGAVLVDCGEGTQVAIMESKKKIQDITAICITHHHGDHVLGLPGLLVTMNQTLVEAGRKKALIIIAPLAAKDVVLHLISAVTVYNVYIRFIWLKDDVETIYLPGLDIAAVRLVHSVDCYGYAFTCYKNGKLSFERAGECAVTQEQWSLLQRGYTILTDKGKFTADSLSDENRKSLKICYATDTQPCDGLRVLAQNANLAVLEGMYPASGMSARGGDANHLTFEEAARIAKDAGSKELWLTHFSPAVSRPDRYISAAAEIFPNAKCGFRGLSREMEVSNVQDKKAEGN